MPIRASLGAIMLVAGTTLSTAPVQAEEAEDRCSAETLSAKIHKAMKERGETDAGINFLLSDAFTRRIVQSRVADRTDCSENQVEAAIERLEVATRR